MGIVRDVTWGGGRELWEVVRILAVLVLLGLVLVVLAATYATAGLLAAARPVTRGPYLSGAAPREHAVSRFHVRWYPVTLIFLAFDMEMVFMYPWAVVFAQVGVKALVEMFVFLALLMLGVTYAWREGALRWV